MSSFVKTLAVVLAGLVATVVVAADKAGDAKSKKPETKESADKKGKKDKDKGKEMEKDKSKASSKDKPTTPDDPDAAPRPFDVPMPNGRNAKGIKIPVRDADGKMMQRYIIGVATKVDDTHLEMSELQVETFDENGEHEMTMDLPTAVMDLSTWVITAYHPVKIDREDFVLTGNTMIFNTRTKQGGLGGGVKMVINNLFDEPKPAPAAATPQAATSPVATPAP